MKQETQDIKKALEILKTDELKKCLTYCDFSEETGNRLITEKVKAEYHYFKWCNKKGSNWTDEKISKDLNDYWLNIEGLISWINHFWEIKKAILDKRLLLNCVSNNALNWCVHYVISDKIMNISLTDLKALNCYRINYKEGSILVNAYGTSRTLEIIESMGRRLGLTFEQIPQSQQVI